MKLLKEASIQLIIALNVFILFIWLTESRIALPPILMAAGRAHPLVLHFPIVLLVLAALVAYIPNKLDIQADALRKIKTLFLFGAALTAGLTAVFGLFLSKEEGYSGQILEWHKWAGITTSILAALLVWMDLRFANPTPSSRAMVSGTFVLALAALIAAGHWGATLTHGDSFLTAPLIKNTAEPIDLQNAVVYPDLIVPILREKCYSCHNQDKSKGELILTDTKSLLSGGKSGVLFVNERPRESLLIKRLLLDINHKHHMPPKGKVQMGEDEIALLTSWISAGGSLTAKISEMKGSDSLYLLAKAHYSEKKEENLTFSPADADVVQGFNGTEWVVTPVSFQSPGLDAVCFNRSGFNAKSMEKISAVGEQLVSLNLSGLPVKDAYLEKISAFPHLRQINLNYTEISDKGLEKLAAIKTLESVMLTGTNITDQGIERLARVQSVKHIYAWNTAITAIQAASIRKKHPRVRIEIGLREENTEELTLNVPVISPSSAYFREPFTLNITHSIHGTQLSYTLDGTSPDSALAKLFNKPLSIQGNTFVRAKAARDGWKGSLIVERNFQRSAIRPDSFSLQNQPHPLHKGNGVETLFDLADGSTDILYASDGKWLGYKGSNAVVEMKFTKPTVVSIVTLSTLTSVALEAFPPAVIQLWGMDISGKYKLLTEQKPTQPADKTPVERTMLNCPVTVNTPLSRLKILVIPLSRMPGWHPKKGQPAWFFIDEILLN
jgi:uncharacterized membrane protein